METVSDFDLQRGGDAGGRWSGVDSIIGLTTVPDITLSFDPAHTLDVAHGAPPISSRELIGMAVEERNRDRAVWHAGSDEGLEDRRNINRPFKPPSA